MTWDAFQRDALAELGVRPYDMARAPSAVDRVSPDLTQALIRAGRCTAGQLEALSGLDALPAPRAKRALWPQLRRLRANTQ